MNNATVAELDVETRSACPLRSTGSWRYSLDPSTELLCAVFRLPTWAPGRTGLYHPSFPHLGIEEGDDFNDLAEFFEWVTAGGLVESHNSFFESGIWRNVLMARHGWPELPIEQRRCSAAKAASHSLPRGLGDAVNALGLSVQKDDEGAKVMKKLSKPRKALKSEWDAWGQKHRPCQHCGATGKYDGVNPETGRKKRLPCEPCHGRGWRGTREALPEMPVLWHESKELFERLFAYCRQDVLAEEALSHSLPDLSDDELAVYHLDQRINERGFQLDEEAIDVALDLVDGEFKELNQELAELTGGKVVKASQRAKMVAWFAEQGLELDDSKADTIEETLKQTDLAPHVRRCLELVSILGQTSTKKYVAMANWICPDRRVHGGLLYHGASTGRWSGAGVQPHNFPRGTVKDDQDVLWSILKTRDRDTILAEYGDVMEALSSALRGVIIPSDGHELHVADFAGIEARVLLWLAEDEDGLDIFRQKRDIYNDMATDIFGRPVNRKLESDKKEGALGKEAILGLGFQMGWKKFADRCRANGIDISDEMAQKIVETYRTKFWRTKNMWRDQEKSAIRAVQWDRGPDRPVHCGRVSWFMDNGFLYCTLPSGRRLAYPEPKVAPKMMPWSEEKISLTYMGMATVGPKRWVRQNSYGGLLVENITQAVARDLMAAAALRAEESGLYKPILTVHDEMLAEAPKGAGDVHEFEQLMAALPPWAVGCPVAAEGWSGPRYRK